MPDLTPEQEKQLADQIGKMFAFSMGTSKVCPVCDGAITGMRLYAKIEPQMFSLYVLPCNHRIGLWADAPGWAKADGLPIEIIESEY